MILRNSILCLHCDTEIVSSHRHDFVGCNCNPSKCFCDGGGEYLRRSGNQEDYIDTSIMDDGKHETRRKYLKWGRNYDKDMNRLPNTQWISIEEMKTDHISAILKGGWVKEGFYKDMFELELKYRQDEKTKMEG